jgi:hypothetical protein
MYKNVVSINFTSQLLICGDTENQKIIKFLNYNVDGHLYYLTLAVSIFYFQESLLLLYEFRKTSKVFIYHFKSINMAS